MPSHGRAQHKHLSNVRTHCYLEAPMKNARISCLEIITTAYAHAYENGGAVLGHHSEGLSRLSHWRALENIGFCICTARTSGECAVKPGKRKGFSLIVGHSDFSAVDVVMFETNCRSNGKCGRISRAGTGAGDRRRLGEKSILKELR